MKLGVSVYQGHPYHLVSISPWPLLTSISIINLAYIGTIIIHRFILSINWLLLSFFCLIQSISLWFRDVIREGSFHGDHTKAVKIGLSYGITFFIISEILFFFSIFWAYFHSSLSPAIELGCSWPPIGILPLNPYSVPLLNTIILLSSGASVTLAHHAILKGNRYYSLLGIIITLILAIVFTYLQAEEYWTATFNFSDSVFGSVFYIGTGFHGFHVIIGTIFLFISFIRIYLYHLTQRHHINLESSIAYWHIVDVVWLFLFLSVYIWGY